MYIILVTQLQWKNEIEVSEREVLQLNYSSQKEAERIYSTLEAGLNFDCHIRLIASQNNNSYCIEEREPDSELRELDFLQTYLIN